MADPYGDLVLIHTGRPRTSPRTSGLPQKLSISMHIVFTSWVSGLADEGQMICIGTRGYGAPELLLHDQKAHPAMDVFSFGAMMLQTFISPDMAEANILSHSVRSSISTSAIGYAYTILER